MSLSFIHSMALLVLTSRLFITSWMVSATAIIVLLSAKLCKSAPSKKNMTFMNMLNNTLFQVLIPVERQTELTSKD